MAPSDADTPLAGAMLDVEATLERSEVIATTPVTGTKTVVDIQMSFQVRPHMLYLMGLDVRVYMYVHTYVHIIVVRHCGSVVRTLDSLLRGPGIESSCCCFKAWVILFTPHCLSSLSCINEDLARDSHVSDGYE